MSATSAVLEEHQRLLRRPSVDYGGVERSTEGDSFYVIFPDAPSAIATAVAAQRTLAEQSLERAGGGREFADRPWFVALEAISDPDLYPSNPKTTTLRV